MQVVDDTAKPWRWQPCVAGQAALPYPERYRERLLLCTLHDGEQVPAFLLEDPAIHALYGSPEFVAAFNRERDWGADLVASQLAAALGLPRFLRVNLARVVLDFNRFPGETPPHAGPMQARALSAPLATLLSYEHKRRLLSGAYDTISDAFDAALPGRLLSIAIHTYDAQNTTLTTRPEVSLLTRSDSYQNDSRLPWGLFDPLFPDVLAESCAIPVIRDRVALTLEKAGVAVTHNYPYCLPDGSVELRSQPWYFFQHLRQAFEAAEPAAVDEPAYAMVWSMLQNTNQRGGISDALSGYLHRFHRPPDGLQQPFARAMRAYEHIRRFSEGHPELVRRYRRSQDRTSAITIEVRKDLVWRFEDGIPRGPRDKNAGIIARLIAQGIATYLRTDREEHTTTPLSR